MSLAIEAVSVNTRSSTVNEMAQATRLLGCLLLQLSGWRCGLLPLLSSENISLSDLKASLSRQGDQLLQLQGPRHPLGQVGILTTHRQQLIKIGQSHPHLTLHNHSAVALLHLTQAGQPAEMEWKRAAWTLIPVAGMSMLTVLFLVLWQALGHQTSSINELQQRLSELEQLLQERPSANDALLDQQLQQLQKNQRELEDRISRTALQKTELLELEQQVRRLSELQQNQTRDRLLPDPFSATP